MHRLLHTPTASGGQMSDIVDTVEEALALAQGVNVRFRQPFSPLVQPLTLTSLSRRPRQPTASTQFSTTPSVCSFLLRLNFDSFPLTRVPLVRRRLRQRRPHPRCRMPR